MPVNQLLCEGGNNSPDVVVLRKLLIGRCGVIALGTSTAWVQPGCPRHRSYLHAFAGKDLLWSLDESLRGFGLASAWSFRDKVLDGIEMSPDDLGAWLPEWAALQRAIDNT